MAVSAHLETLQSKHTHLEEKIQAELPLRLYSDAG